MTSRKLSLKARTLKALSQNPEVLRSIPSPLKYEAENELASLIQRRQRKQVRNRTREDIYYGEPDKLTKAALIRIILDQGYGNEDLLEIIRQLYEFGEIKSKDIKITITNPESVFEFLLNNISNVEGDEDIFIYPDSRQKQFLELFHKRIINELYKGIVTNEIREQREKGEGFDLRGGRKKRRKRKTRKKRR